METIKRMALSGAAIVIAFAPMAHHLPAAAGCAMRRVECPKRDFAPAVRRQILRIRLMESRVMELVGEARRMAG